MAEEFEAGVWWMSPRTAFNWSSVITDFGGCWPRDYNLVDMKSKSSDDSSDGSMVLGTTTGTMSPDSAFQTTDWDQNLLLIKVQEEMNTFTTSRDDDDQERPLNFTTTTPYHHYPSTFYSPPLYNLQSNSDNFNLVQNLPFWPSPFPSPSSSYKDKQNALNLTTKPNHQGIQDSGELPLKRPRLETPSPLPTFKVRKEKLGDRITALQQLVSPFGKTDTASVLHEAIDYIKLLHDQVNILSAPYMKNAAATKRPQQIHDKVKDMEDLRSLGLCLVPVSSTFPMATDMASGFWTPNHQGQFR